MFTTFAQKYIGSSYVYESSCGNRKPFAAEVVAKIKVICQEAGYEFIALEKCHEQADLVKAVKSVDAMIVRSDKEIAEVVNNADNLKIVMRVGAGYDILDLAAATAKNIVCMNIPGQNSNAVAELVFGMMVYLAHNQFNPKAVS